MPVNILIIIPEAFGPFRNNTVALRLLTQQKSGRILIAKAHPVVSDGEEIDTLCVANLRCSNKFTQPELHMALVSGRFLALPIGIDVFEDTAIHRPMQKMIKGIVEHFFII